ncbi:ATP-binding protein [Salidesulfovibrio onnuriiensis]|uniref:ATP-binding protein n=1 Tax=Salidesulfovibrio onnuriiensis TaxID=2583823 RepID=UPI0011C79E20|nr:ATP-binding protein [Salidesulfovibrio onnuriiensis]
MPEQANSVSLRLPADPSMIPVAQRAAETSAKAFGLEAGKALRLTMAVEEIVAYLASLANEERIGLDILPRSDHVTTRFSFRAADADLHALNLTSRGDLSSDEAMQTMGLLLASRMTDDFEIHREGRELRLSLRMNRAYPAVEPEVASRFDAKGAVTVTEESEPAQIKRACSLALALYQPHELPLAFRTPGKVVDTTLGGDMHTALALDESGAVCGMICWESRSEKSVSFDGPYVFATQREETARLLVDHLVNAVARTSTLGLFGLRNTEDLPEGDFEMLATLPMIGLDKATREIPIWFRHLREDNGMVVWAPESLTEFLEQAYDELVLMRDIQPTNAMGEHVSGRSVFAVKLNKESGQATLRPMLAGADSAENIRQHVQVLKQEGCENIIVHLDLGSGWQAALADALLENGFQPRLVLPYAGQSDVAVFAHV